MRELLIQQNGLTSKTIIVSLGSTTQYTGSLNKPVLRLNSIEGVKNSSNKLLMKRCFDSVGSKTADWWFFSNNQFYNDKQTEGVDILPYPIVCKKLYGSKGLGNTKINSKEDFLEWKINKNLHQYIFEKYIDYKREYRIHCSSNGIFSAFRKLRKNGSEKWFFNTNNCVFKIVTPELQAEVGCWNTIEEDLKKALTALKLDFAGFDVRVKNDGSDYCIIESNSAPGLLTKGTEDYYNEIIKLIKQKWD